jgi:hypothetical protein
MRPRPSAAFAAFAALLAIAGVPHLAACIGLSCSHDVKPSVEITVIALMGEEEVVQTDAVVTFSLDGGAEQPAECVTPVTGGGGCEAFRAGLEQTGSFVVKATSADGTKLAEVTVDVDADECHVITQSVKLTLQ